MLADPGNHRLHIRRVFGSLPESRQERWRLAIRGCIDDHCQQALIDKQLSAAHQEIPLAPAERAIGRNLQSAMSAGEENDRRLGRGRGENQQALRDARAGGDVDNPWLDIRPDRQEAKPKNGAQRELDCVCHFLPPNLESNFAFEYQ
jgi:hypothetical protein